MPKATCEVEHAGLEPESHKAKSVSLGKHLGKGETQEGALLGRLALCSRQTGEALSLREAAG